MGVLIGDAAAQPCNGTVGQPVVTSMMDVDAEVAAGVRRSLAEHDNVRIRRLDVTVDAGVVTLEGHVATSAEKHLASRYVQDVVGVSGVVNALIVSPAWSATQSSTSGR